MASLEHLPSTTFSGRRFTRKQLEQVCETVAMFPKLSRKELAQTICEHLEWKNARGANKTACCLRMLETLETEGLVTLPGKRDADVAPKHRVQLELAESDGGQPVVGRLEDLAPITLVRIVTDEDRAAFKATIQTHHYLGYKHAIGNQLGYFVVSQRLSRRLGCLNFAASSSWNLPARDQWIGWDKHQRDRARHLVVTQQRFLIFPWVNVPNLASHVLAMSEEHLISDWLEIYGYRPVLLESFVETARFSGRCYLAANWQKIGQTQQRKLHNEGTKAGREQEQAITVKDIYVRPLSGSFRRDLTEGLQARAVKKRYRNDLQASRTRSVDDEFVSMWHQVVDILHRVAEQYDRQWRVRRRVLGSLLLMVLIFRLVVSKNSQSYGTTIDELWDSYRTLDLPMPQEQSVKPASFCRARRKLHEDIFKRVNREVLDAYAPQTSGFTWQGHRLLAVDGSKINLPRALLQDGYTTPSDNANYPQGLLSCLYELKSQLPQDFHLAAHMNERLCAKQHLDTLQANDVVVYDRGYYSYVLLHQHRSSGVHAIFRLHKQSGSTIQTFIDSPRTDALVTICPGKNTRADLRREHPEIEIVPLPMRLLKYTLDDVTFCLGTTLVEDHQQYALEEFMEVYHGRWGVEELYKISKRIIDVEDFHAKSERGVKQEVFAHFTLITMSRLFANQADSDLNTNDASGGSGVDKSAPDESTKATPIKDKLRTNFKNCIHVVARNLEHLLLVRDRVAATVAKVFKLVAGQYQRVRPGRSNPRKSMRPDPRWRPGKKKSKKKTGKKAVATAGAASLASA